MLHCRWDPTRNLFSILRFFSDGFKFELERFAVTVPTCPKCFSNDVMVIEDECLEFTAFRCIECDVRMERKKICGHLLPWVRRILRELIFGDPLELYED